MARDGLGCGGEDSLCGPPTGRHSFCLLQRSASPEGGRLRGGEVGDVMRVSTQRLPRWEGFSSCSVPRSRTRAPRESLLPLCWPLGPMRHLNSLPQASDPVDTYSMGVGNKEQWPSGTLPAPSSHVLNWVCTLQASGLTAPAFWLQAVPGRGLGLPLTAPLQPARIHPQLYSHTHPGLLPSHSVLPRHATGESGLE